MTDTNLGGEMGKDSNEPPLEGSQGKTDILHKREQGKCNCDHGQGGVSSHGKTEQLTMNYGKTALLPESIKRMDQGVQKCHLKSFKRVNVQSNPPKAQAINLEIN